MFFTKAIDVSTNYIDAFLWFGGKKPKYDYQFVHICTVYIHRREQMCQYRGHNAELLKN